jgi:hypothetical protein
LFGNKLINGYNVVIKLLCIHLSLTTITLPILIAWGLPLSLLSPISSLLIGPFISVYLILTSLIFFSELLYLPNAFLYWLLEHASKKLIYILAYKPFGINWMIGFIKPTWYWLLLLFILPYLLLLLIRNKTNFHKLWYLFGYLLFVSSALKLQTPIKTLSCTYRSRTIKMVYHNNTLTVFDPGTLALHASGHRWFNFTVMQTIIKNTGKTTIDNIIISHPRIRAINALTELIEHIPIKTIYLPYWRKNEGADGRIIKLMYQLKHKAQHYGCTVKFINEKQKIMINKNCIIKINKKQSSYQNISYFPLIILTNLSNE